MGASLLDGRIRLVWTDRSVNERRFEVNWGAPGRDIEPANDLSWRGAGWEAAARLREVLGGIMAVLRRKPE